MIYGIGDLHLSNGLNKPMDIFGNQWIDHGDKIKKNWNRIVKDEDLVIICGDISWALKINDAIADIEWIKTLKGHKIIVKGNHDLWWASKNKMNRLFNVNNQDMFFLFNDAYCYDNYTICGTRGWICQGAEGFTKEDEKIYKREAKRLENSLKEGRRKGDRLIVGMHYPPMNEKREPSLFTELFCQYGVETVLYGHLHGEEAFGKGPKGIIKGINYKLVSADYLNFKLELIEEIV